ncbi:MAG TPA: helix-turn-helix domain-containing protein [Phycisphaerae bacterium]|jgi:hypothetical protein
MPKEIYPSSYECDCGQQLHFFENTIREMKQISFRKRAGIGEGDDRHGVIFHKGQMVAIFCPKAGKELSALPAEMTAAAKPARRTWTERQGQVLAFIHLYTKLNRQPPAEADVARYFEITPPAAHQMILTLERKGLIERRPGTPRSIALTVDPEDLPNLE